MVLILSKELDKSTNEVMSWLLSQGKIVKRLNNEDLIDKIRISINSFLEQSYIDDIDLDAINRIWVRKGQLPIFKGSSEVEINEFPILKEFILHSIESLPHTTGSILSELNHNKLTDFKLALDIGLKCPKSWVINKREELIKILQSNEWVLVKPLKDSYRFETDDNMIYFDMFLLSKALLDLVDNSFFPSLIQEVIPKEFEIRAFYFRGKYFCTAIFPLNRDKSSISYKDELIESNLNRMVPMELSEDIKVKLDKLLLAKNLNSASIDMIYNEGEYYFLEVNSVGQFDWVSKSCNFYIEKYISENL